MIYSWTITPFILIRSRTNLIYIFTNILQRNVGLKAVINNKNDLQIEVLDEIHKLNNDLISTFLLL